MHEEQVSLLGEKFQFLDIDVDPGGEVFDDGLQGDDNVHVYDFAIDLISSEEVLLIIRSYFILEELTEGVQHLHLLLHKLQVLFQHEFHQMVASDLYY